MNHTEYSLPKLNNIVQSLRGLVSQELHISEAVADHFMREHGFLPKCWAIVQRKQVEEPEAEVS